MSRLRTRSPEPLVWSVKTGRAITHGRPAGYSTHGCGCDPCYTAFVHSGTYLRERDLQWAVSDGLGVRRGNRGRNGCPCGCQDSS